MEKVCGVTKALPWALSFILAFAAAEVSVAAPVTTSLPAVADTTLRQQQANQNRGGDEQVRLGWAQGSRALVRFDPAAVAAAVSDGTLISAHLELDVEATGESWPGGSQNVGAHRVTAAWTETGATWNCAIDAQPADNRADCNPQWNGGSFLAAATATVPHTKETRGLVRFDVTADVAAFLAGTANHGWLLKKANETLLGRIDYVSREGTVAARAPRLVVVVEPRSGGDQTPPSLVFAEPLVPVLVDQPSVQVRIEYSDLGSGVDAASFKLRLEDVDITSTCAVGAASATCQTPPLTTATNGASEHRLDAEARDRAGNLGVAALTLVSIQGQGDVEAPEVLISVPAAGALLKSQPATVSGLTLDDGVVQSVTVNGVPATLDDASFAASVPLFEGENLISVRATDGSGKSGEASVTVTLDTTPPRLELETPAPGLVTNADLVTVRGTAADDSGIARVTVDGTQVPLVGGAFEATIALAAGPRTIVVTAVDTAGNETSVTRVVSRFSVPRLAVTSPADLSSTTASEITVEGTIEGTGIAVAVNGVAAQVSENTFVATGVPLIAGPNLVTAVATDAAGHASTVTITVLRDVSEPRLAVSSPRDGAVVFPEAIAVHGFVSDHGEGALDTPPPTVTVNGVTAVVANETFLASGVPIAPGANTLTVVATDAAGNREQVSLTVRRETAPARRVQVVSGSLQSAVIGSLLPEPLVAQVLDDAGQPVAGRPVLFTAGNDGSFPGDLRQIAVTTDSQGRAATPFTLGMRAGAGNQIVEASVAGFAGPAVFVLTGLTGTPALIVADSGDQQIAAAGQPLPLTLAAAVTDNGFNRLADVPVRFRVEAGGGSFANGEQELVVETDHLGRAVVSLRLGPGEGIGNNVVEATVVGSDPALVTGFSASGRIAGDPAATSISGVVLDNSNQPVPGATLRILDTTITTQTDEQGLFRIAPAPVGTIKLIVDGSTTSRPGTWPDLEFILTTVPGRDNTVGMPIFLLPLELGNSVVVDETRGGTLTLPDFPGFALEIQPGSVTFPSGSRSGLISVTVVHADKVPMIPNFGQQPRFIVTIQPANAIFEPPARLTLPNLDGLPPGAVTEMYSFDHDLGRFVSIGLATVSDDGTAMTSTPGAGVRKAGWHCGGNPSGSGTPHDCPTCKTCINNRCEPVPFQALPDNTPGDCNEPICFMGGVASSAKLSDTPPQIPGDCKRKECALPGAAPPGVPVFGVTREVDDNSDTPPGKGCCGGTPYDPATQCCTPVIHRIVPKNPMPVAWPVECPNRKPRNGFPRPGNGCGSPVLPVPVPENPNVHVPGCGNAAFTPACNWHDECYDTCGSSKAACDFEFLGKLYQICASQCTNFLSRQICEEFANAYFQAVSNLGHLPWFQAQREACECC